MKSTETTRFHTKLFVEMLISNLVSTTRGWNNFLRVCSKSKDWKAK